MQGDNISTVGDNISTVGDNISTVEGIQYSGGMPSESALLQTNVENNDSKVLRYHRQLVV